jgi:hypothetical protein
MTSVHLILLWIFPLVMNYSIAAANENTTLSVPTTTTSIVVQECSHFNGSCGNCVSQPKCFWCESPSEKCILYPIGEVFPNSKCALQDARWGVCWVNYQVLLIVVCVLAVVIIFTIVTCIYCCCCKINRSLTRRRDEQDEETTRRSREEREMKSTERKIERQARYDEIRRKYGLKKDEGSAQYSRLDNEP